MIVFHGSNMEVATPFVHLGRNNLDFGKGFYVTTLLKQATRWAISNAMSATTNPHC